MTMNKINASALTQSQLLEQYSRTRENKSSSFAGSQNISGLPTPAATQPAKGDHAEISETAHKLVDMREALDVGRAAVGSEPEARADRIALARERIDSGFYQSAEVRDRVAGKLESLVVEGRTF